MLFRSLSDTKQRSYYQALQQWFSVQTQWQLVESKTITGGEEGVLGWLAVNYQLGTLSSADMPLVNVMDMGGASVQVTFPVQDVEKIDSHDLFEIDVYGRHLIIFAHSFLGLGQTVLSQQFLDAENCLGDKEHWERRLKAINQNIPTMNELNGLLKSLAESYRLGIISPKVLGKKIEYLCQLPKLQAD